MTIIKTFFFSTLLMLCNGIDNYIDFKCNLVFISFNSKIQCLTIWSIPTTNSCVLNSFWVYIVQLFGSKQLTSFNKRKNVYRYQFENDVLLIIDDIYLLSICSTKVAGINIPLHGPHNQRLEPFKCPRKYRQRP